MLDTATRVEDNTAAHLNRKVEQSTQERISFYRRQDRESITRRLDELDREWDTERTLQTNFAILSTVGAGLTAKATVGAGLTAKVHNRWAWLALGVPGFMIQHGLQGWCPPLAVLRRLGVRTAREINEERFALKALRGDFDAVADSNDAEAIIRAVQQ